MRLMEALRAQMNHIWFVSGSTAVTSREELGPQEILYHTQWGEWVETEHV